MRAIEWCGIAGLILASGAGAAMSGEPLETWDECYRGNALPEAGDWPWTVSAGANTSALPDGECLRIADQGTAKGELRFYSRQWHACEGSGGVVEARLKVVSCSGRSGVILMVADGASEVSLTLYPGRLELGSDGLTEAMDTASAFHSYRLELSGARVRLAVDDKRLVDVPVGLAKAAHEGRNLVGFGSCSSQATGEALWEYVRHRTFAPPVRVVDSAEHVVVFKKPGVYACFPGLIQRADGSLYTSFGTRTRRSHIDPSGGGAAFQSRDGGKTWQPAQKGEVRPEHLRKDGGVAHASAYGWREVPKEREAEFRGQGLTVRDVRPGVVAYLGGAYAFQRRGGEPEGTRIALPTPERLSLMSYNSSALCITRSGVRMNAVYGRRDGGGVDSSFALRSADDGETWEMVTIAEPVKEPGGEGELGFGETALVEAADGRVIAMMRPDPDRHGYLWQSESADGGRTWSKPVKTPLWGYPAHLLVLRDGRLLCSYGYRKAPMGIRACLSRDGGRSWEFERELVIRADGKRSGSDLGYPVSCELVDGVILTLYYFTGGDGITHVAATRWRIP